MERTFAFLLHIMTVDDPNLLVNAQGLGDYGYRHLELHEKGQNGLSIIEELSIATGRGCCDGVGECRVTTFKENEYGQMTVLVDGQFCPLPAYVEDFTELPLPTDMDAVVCASEEPLTPHGCPMIYCFARQELGY